MVITPFKIKFTELHAHSLYLFSPVFSNDHFIMSLLLGYLSVINNPILT